MALATLLASFGSPGAFAQDDHGKNVRCPAGVKLTPVEIVRLAIPDYEQKLAWSKAQLADKNDEEAWWNTYGAWLTQCKRSDLTMEGRHFLVVTIHQIQTRCEDCHSVVLGVIDLDHGNRTQSIEMRGRLRTLDGPAGSARHANNAPIMILRTAVGSGFNGGLLEKRVTMLNGDKPTFRLEASEEKTVESWEGGRPSR